MIKLRLPIIVFLILSTFFPLITQAQDIPKGEDSAEITLEEDFDAHLVFLESVGSVAINSSNALSCFDSLGECVSGCRGETCMGFVGNQPNYTVKWEGKTPYLNFYFVGDGNPVMIIQQSVELAPGYRGYTSSYAYYNDNFMTTTLHPGIAIENVAAGDSIDYYTFDIWIGTPNVREFTSGILFVVEGDYQPYQALAPRYYMDGDASRVINTGFLMNNLFRVSESTSPWPWDGAVAMIDDKLIGYADFLKTDARMMVYGTLMPDASTRIQYHFVDLYGDKTGRIDPHTWFIAP